MIERYINIVFDSSKAEQGAKRLDRSLKNVGKSADRLNASNGKAEGGTKRLDRSLHGASKSADRLSTSLKDAAKPLNSMVNGVNSLRASMNPLAAAISGVVTAQKVISYADAWKSVQNQLRQVTDSSGELKVVTDDLFEVAQETRSSIESTADLYSKLSRSTKNLNLSSKELVSITGTINKLFASGGASAESAAGAILQLGQGLASGALRGDEFNSVAEQAPGIMRAIAKETKLTIGELRDFAADGNITSELLVKSIQNYSDTAQAEFDKTERTFSQSMQESRNNAIKFMEACDALTGTVGATGDAIVFLSENLDVAMKALVVFSAVLGARGVASLLSYIATSKAFAGAVGVSTVMLGRNTVAVKGATLATQGLTVAANGARAAMALLGGPAGVFTLAAMTVGYFGLKALKAEEPTKNLSEEVHRLTEELRGLDAVKTDQKIQSLGEEIVTVSQLRANAERALSAAQKESIRQTDLKNESIEGGTRADIDAEEAVRKHSKTLDKYNSQLKFLNGLLSAAKGVKIEREVDGLSDIEDPFGDGHKVSNVKVATKLEGVENETGVLKKEYDLRSELYAEYGQKIYDQSLSDHERQLAALDYRLKEERSREKTKHIRDLARLKKKKQDLLAQENVSSSQEEAINKAFNDRKELLEQAHELRLTEITAQGENARSELKGGEEKRLSDLMASLQLETAAMRQAYDLRSELYTEYGQKVYDQSLSDHERQLAALDYRLQEEINSEKVRYAELEAARKESYAKHLSEIGINTETELEAVREKHKKLFDENANFDAQTFSSLQEKHARLLDEEGIKTENDLARMKEKYDLILGVEIEFQEQEKILLAEHNLTLEEIEKQHVGAILEIKQAKAEADRNMAIDNALFATAYAAKQSKKAFKIHKVAAISEAIVSGKKSAVEAYKSGMSTGGPHAPAVAAAYTAASLARTGAMIAQIGSSSYGAQGMGGAAVGGSFGGTRSFSSSSSPTLPSSSASSRPARESPQKVIELRGLDENKLFSTKDVLEILREADVAVVINDSITEARRIGAINDDDDEW